MKTDDQKFESALARWQAKLEGTPYAIVAERALVELRAVQAEVVYEKRRAEWTAMQDTFRGQS